MARDGAELSNPDHRRTASLALFEMTKDTASFQGLVAQGALPALLRGCLSSDPVVVAHAVGSLANLAADYELQPDIAFAGGVGVVAAATAASRRWSPPYHLSAPVRADAARFLVLLTVPH